MKTKLKYALIAVAMIGLLTTTGCAGLFGANPKPPTQTEQVLYTTVTNYATQTVTETNVVWMTNQVGSLVLATNIVTVTNEVPQYLNTPNKATSTTVSGIGLVLDSFFPGIGSMVSSGLLALLALWGHLRSSKSQTTAATIAQEVETLRVFIQSLPGGTKYDTAIVSWLQQHQIDANVSQQVLSLLDKSVSNPDARVAVEEISKALTALQQQATVPVVQPPVQPSVKG